MPAHPPAAPSVYLQSDSNEKKCKKIRDYVSACKTEVLQNTMRDFTRLRMCVKLLKAKQDTS